MAAKTNTKTNTKTSTKTDTKATTYKSDKEELAALDKKIKAGTATKAEKQRRNEVYNLVNHPAQTTNTTNTQTTLTNGAPQADGTTIGGVNSTGVTNTTDADAIERAKKILGVGEQFGRGIGNEFYSTGSLGRQAEVNTPEEIAALAQAQQLASVVGNQTDAVGNLISQQQGILNNAQSLSPVELEALRVAREALPGLDAKSMEALRSAARASIQGQFQAEARQLAKAQARNQVFGSAATAQNNLLGQAGVREGRNLERDLLVKNIEIKQAAQNAFTGLATNTEANRSARTNAASGQLTSTVLSDEAQRNSARQGAVNSQATIAGSLADRLRQLREFNLGQAAAEKAGQVGSVFGGIGAISDQRGLLAGEDFANTQYADSKAIQEKILGILKDSLKAQS